LTGSGISVTGVTKAVCGHPAIARAMLDGGVVGLAESRLTNVERLRSAGIMSPIVMIRTPVPSQSGRIARNCDASYNTEIDVIRRLASAARRTGNTHGIILMVEMGDMRDGIMPEDVAAVAQQVSDLPGVLLKGIGANFACLNGMVPNAMAMARFSALASQVESAIGSRFEAVSGGNSANIPWALVHGARSRVNDLRLGEAILLGVDPVSGTRIDGLHTDAFTLVAEIIETKAKTAPVHRFSTRPSWPPLKLVAVNDQPMRSILAVGEQDTDVAGLSMPDGILFVGGTSDHLVVQNSRLRLAVGSEVSFQMNYAALMRAMNAPDVCKVLHNAIPFPAVTPSPHGGRFLETA